MDARQLFGLSTLVLAGAVSAQTVPAEQWVGAPIPAAGSLSRASVAAEAEAGSAIAQAPQELRVGPADVAPGTLSRAEVAADLNLWIKSGLAQVSQQDNFDPSGPTYRAQLATYQRMRNGPAFIAEVQRLKGARTEVMTSAGLESESGAN